MSFRTSLRNGAEITRAEWRRHLREFGRPVIGQPLLLAAHLVGAFLLGWGAYSVGQTLSSGQPLPNETVAASVSVAFVWMIWRSSQYTHSRFERLEPAFLLTAVRARTAALGLLGFVYARLLLTLAVPAIGVAVGTAVGLQSPTAALTVLVSATGLAGLAAGIGTVGRLAARLVSLRLVRVRYFRDLLVVFGWIPLLIGAVILQELSISIAPLVGVFGAFPIAWFVDLALVFVAGDAGLTVRHAVGALALLAVGIPILSFGTSTIARRVWESDPASATGTRGSKSLLDVGILERFAGDRIPRSVYTVARERWLLERRVPQGLLSSGYALLFMGVIVFPLVALAGGASTVLLFVAVTLGLVAGIAFGSDPIGTEYRVLPMLLTSVRGRQFVAGLLLAATVVGVPLIALGTVPLGLVGPVGVGRTVLIACVGMSVCACTAAVAVATGLGVEKYDYAPTPFFFTDVPIYAEHGLGPFLRYGLILVIGILSSVPAFVGTAPPVYGRIAAVGVPAILVQVGSLLLALILIAAVTRTAYRTAVDRFRDYRIN